MPGRALSPFDSGQESDGIVLRVENQNLHDATLYLLREGQRQELGTIRGGGLQFIDFGWPVGLPLTIEIQLEVGERYRPPPFPLSGGGQLRLTVAAQLRRSAFYR